LDVLVVALANEFRCERIYTFDPRCREATRNDRVEVAQCRLSMAEPGRYADLVMAASSRLFENCNLPPPVSSRRRHHRGRQRCKPHEASPHPVPQSAPCRADSHRPRKLARESRQRLLEPWGRDWFLSSSVRGAGCSSSPPFYGLRTGRPAAGRDPATFASHVEAKVTGFPRARVRGNDGDQTVIRLVRLRRRRPW
jgi:hypothetical protein